MGTGRVLNVVSHRDLVLKGVLTKRVLSSTSFQLTHFMKGWFRISALTDLSFFPLIQAPHRLLGWYRNILSTRSFGSGSTSTSFGQKYWPRMTRSVSSYSTF